MATNFLEQLVAEWYEFDGYFVRRNVLVGKRPRGGYECELDVVGFNPERQHLVHLETSMDALSWTERDRRFAKKFDAGRKFIPELFPGTILPGEPEQIAVLVFGGRGRRTPVGGGRLLFAGELLEQIFHKLKTRRLASHAVPEQFTILRSFQFVAEYREFVRRALA